MIECRINYLFNLFKNFNNLIFDGEYLNCKIWNGKQYKYNLEGKLISELIYVQGKKAEK